MRLVWIALGVLLGLVAIVITIGAMLPRRHVASMAMQIDRPPAEVYAAIRDFGSFPKWRADVSRVELLGVVSGHEQFREHASHGAVTYEVVEDVPGQKLVTRIVDRDLGYSGSWTYSIAAADGGSMLRITENGDVPNPLFRFMSRFVFGHTATMQRYLAALGKHLA
jgi:Polyketide cyclase / dehydrase and lipid transport